MVSRKEEVLLQESNRMKDKLLKLKLVVMCVIYKLLQKIFGSSFDIIEYFTGYYSCYSMILHLTVHHCKANVQFQ